MISSISQPHIGSTTYEGNSPAHPRKSSGAQIAVAFHEAACAVACQPKSPECRKLVPFQEGHAK